MTTGIKIFYLSVTYKCIKCSELFRHTDIRGLIFEDHKQV